MYLEMDVATEPAEDRQLREIELALTGDSRAMGALYRRFRQSVYSCALRVVGDEHEAEDVTQQVFLKLMTSLQTYVPARGSFQGWLMRIARNAAVDHVRRRRAIPTAEIFGLDTPAQSGPSPLRGALDGALAELPLRQRQALILIHLGFRPAEVAGQMEISEGAVHLLHHRARKRLLARLTSEGIGPCTTGARA